MTRTIRDRARDAILGPFVADAAAAGLHWIYDVDEVKRRAGDEPAFHDPAQNDYHDKRRTGQFTHYGDHALVLLRSVVERGGFDADDYRARMIARFGAADYDGYLDHATKDLIASGKGGNSDHAGALVKLPIVSVLRAPVEQAVRVTHENDAAVRFSDPAEAAIRAAISEGDAKQAVESVASDDVLDASDDTTAFALKAGQTCPVPIAVPVALHSALHGRDFKDVVRRSILAGGDTSGRLFLAAAIRGATDGIPEDWLERVENHAELADLTEKVLDLAGL